jgi:hypothetical protein
MISKNKNIRDLYRGINEFKGNLVKDGNGDLFADSHDILNSRKKVHMAEPSVSGPSHLEVETAIAKLKKV